jgi:RHS repeat-associated protein
VPNLVDVLGVANPTADVTVGVLGGSIQTAARKGEYYHHALAVGNNVYPTIEVKSLHGATQAQTNRVFNPPSTESFVHDADGNLSSDGRWTYIWDAENRLIAMIRDTDSPAGARQRLIFEYDHQGRRVRKRFDTHNGSGWVLSSDTAFAYDGWNLVAELNAASSYARLRTYLWGFDLSGSEQGAGGVGGLLLVTDYDVTTTHHWPAYDGNGNVAALVAQADGSLSARYEYGPFGEAIRATGVMGKKNPIRFSTKYTDDQTGLLYYGYRYYNPATGRWINRDPIEEQGGLNHYAFVKNHAVLEWDYCGLVSSEAEALAILRQTAAAWRARGWTLAPNLLTHFYTKQGPRKYYGSDAEAELLRTDFTFRRTAQYHFHEEALRFRRKGAGVYELEKNIERDWKEKAFGINYPFGYGELFYALGGAHFGYVGEMEIKPDCVSWEARVKMIQRDDYTFRPTGLGGHRLLFPEYAAGHYLETRHRYMKFDDILRWNDRFNGYFFLYPDVPGI